MHRFFIEPHAVCGNEAVLTGEDVQHIAKVLRLRAGDEVTLCDGAKTEYTARIDSVEKERIMLCILETAASKTESSAEITLYQGLPKAGKLETIIQKCVELGIGKVIPFDAERSVVKLSEKDFAKKQSRYQRVAYEAAKQSRRGIIPEVGGLVKLAKEDFSGFDLILLAYEEERGTTLKKALRAKMDAKRIALIVGPEGGFAPEEADMLIQRGAVSVSLGPRILRTETAGMAMLAMTVYELEF
ncbi:MAG: 16S rRNA (uracil(1498)-N(3))-methyltransferase [Clostridia bacterium]|nr:16S rRNA (uracil(1498)-N(3))-methyltransferase [Clostridia bacterium]